MKLGRMFGLGVLARAVVRELRGVREGLAEQNALLKRLADHYAPLPVVPLDDETLRRDTGVSHLNVDELALAEWYVAKVEQEQGMAPTDEQIVRFLADEATVDLAERLSAREAEMQRLSRERSR